MFGETKYKGEQIMYSKKRHYATPLHQRILNRTKIPNDKSKCWEWTGPVNNAGFGLIKGDANQGDLKMVTVHRAMARYMGLDIRHKEVQHTCLNKRCVNPDHLVLGTPKTRTKRIIEKHGPNFMRPKEPRKTCPHCGVTTHIVWFSRIHKDCYAGMRGKYHNKLRRPV